jgi:hypothetical protein
MISRKPMTQEEMDQLVQELEQLSDDLSAYFQFRQSREGLLTNLLTNSTLN